MPRDGAGNFTLVAGNPFITGTTISSSTMNNTLTDIATALTGSLSRSGLGGMLVAFQNTDGALGAPGITWASETGSGFRRAGGQDMRAVINGTDITQWLSTGFKSLLGMTVASGGLTVTAGGLTVSAGGANITGTLTLNGATVNPAGVSAFSQVSGSQSFTSGTVTLVNFGTTVSDSNSGVTSTAPWKYTVQAGLAGWYTIYAMVTLNSGGSWTSASATIEVYKNGTTTLAQENFPWVQTGGIAATAGFLGISICFPCQLAVNDFVQIRVSQTNNSAGAVSCTATANQNFVVITKSGGG